MKHTQLLLYLVLLWIVPGFGQAGSTPNIILIYIDDMNDYGMPINGLPGVEFPGIQQLMSQGTTFYNAHASSPKCGPSRTSMLAGKDVSYTKIYNNPTCKPFTDYFTPGLHNEVFFTLPGYLKSNGYYTYGINKIYHCFDSEPDFDNITSNPCSKSLSWNKYSWFYENEDTLILNYGNAHNIGMHDMATAILPDSLEHLLYDYRAVDSALLFIEGVVNGEVSTCGNPFFMSVGIRKPHSPWYVPEKYFSSDFITNLYTQPFNYPYNTPENSYPYNGVVLAPQPDTIFNDYNNLGLLGKVIADYDSSILHFATEIEDYDPIPQFADGLNEAERLAILTKSLFANTQLGYLAASNFADAQIKRLLDSLALYPEIYHNTVVILVSDNGFSLGEKQHWKKGTMWENDLRVPFIITDFRNPIEQQVFSAVSLLDVFPTICDIASIEKPVQPDGAIYLDGHSLFPFLNNPDIKMEKPSIATYREQNLSQCGCFPQFSIRNNNFHYLYYTSNGVDLTLPCNAEAAWHESELYEIGNNFIQDPHEWNNLIDNEDYQPVINYLQQWLPDSSLYLQKTYLLEINEVSPNCFANNEEILHFSFSIYDTSGLSVTPPDTFLYRWTNNLTTDTLYGNEADFSTTLIDEALFTSAQEMLVFVEMVDTLHQTIVGLALKHVHINSGNMPIVNFNLKSWGFQTVKVEDFTITGDHNNYWWDFGFGPTFMNTIPGPVIFEEEGPYTIKCIVEYGNNVSCENIIEKTFITNIVTFEKNFPLVIAPNPTDAQLTISVPDNTTGGSIFIYTSGGSLVKEYALGAQINNFVINTNDLPQGCYFIKIFTPKTNYSATFIKN